MRRSWEAVVEGTLKRITASSPFEEKGIEKIGAEIAAAGFEICRWEMEAGAGLEADCGDVAGKAGLEDEENELKVWSLSWVLAGSGAGWRSAAAQAVGRSKPLRFSHRPSFPGRQFMQVVFAFVQAQPLQVPVLLHLQHCFELPAITPLFSD